MQARECNFEHVYVCPVTFLYKSFQTDLKREDLFIFHLDHVINFLIQS